MSAPKYCECGRKIVVRPRTSKGGTRRLPKHDMCRQCWLRLLAARLFVALGIGLFAVACLLVFVATEGLLAVLTAGANIALLLAMLITAIGKVSA